MRGVSAPLMSFGGFMWRVEYEQKRSELCVQIIDALTRPNVSELTAVWSDALSSTGGKPFVLFLDMREVAPMDAFTVDALAELKRRACVEARCERIVVLTDSPTVAMQQQRSGGDVNTLVTMDVARARIALSGRPGGDRPEGRTDKGRSGRPDAIGE